LTADFSPLSEFRAELDRTRSRLEQFDHDTPSPRDIALADGLTRQAERVLWAAVRAQRFLGESWRAIGEALGISRQAAHERFRSVDDDLKQHGVAMLVPEELSTEQ
jgi:hypothetical protein